MPVCLARGALVALAFLMGIAGAAADDLADFNAAVEQASAHNRVAIGYLRTGNNDLAQLEIDRMREAWGKVVGTKRPAAFKDPTQFTTVMTDVNVRLVAASMMLGTGRPENAAQSLTGIRDELSKLRRSNGITVLADCILDSNGAAERLMAYDGVPLDAKRSTGPAVNRHADEYRTILDRCNSMAAPAVKQSPEFRRLIDGVKAGLALIPEAVAAKDAERLHRILIELRSFDNLLAFRFG